MYCKLVLIEDDEDDGATPPGIILSSLRSLTLDGAGSVPRFLKSLFVPALHNLRIGESFLGSNTIDTLASFISESRCQLQELCIAYRTRMSEESYRKKFPLMKVSFEDNDPEFAYLFIGRKKTCPSKLCKSFASGDHFRAFRTDSGRWSESVETLNKTVE
ncbi:hypothetical protein DFH08DRAFT_946754 [Mycena albidolilacea]|uniref:Uncharacterized protein n=1 Tax=Mycena albidolilacea TaxID=1033008 RepID=A0AAD7ATE5_9AGAR|nr:hypothetical protein DFH08DRAFT_946754 [Mycena albidolilacea]